MYQFQNLKRFSSRLAVACVQSIEARRSVKKDVFGAAPTGDAPATSEWSTILLPTRLWLIVEVSRYIQKYTQRSRFNSPVVVDVTLTYTLIARLMQIMHG